MSYQTKSKPTSYELRQAVAKFRRLEKRATELCDELIRFEEVKGREFALSIGESGKLGVWEWTGGDRSIPDDICLEVGEVMVGLRACLDIAVYEMSEPAIACGRVRRNQVSFPCVRESLQWTDRTVDWLDEEMREKIRKVQRFAGRQRDVDCAVIGALAAQDKHRGFLELVIVGGSRGAVGAIDYDRASELGLGQSRSDEYVDLGKIHGTPVVVHGRENVVIEGPLGGLALMGAVPLVSARYASNLDMDYEVDRERLNHVSVTESIEQAICEVGEILEVLGSGDLVVSFRDGKQSCSHMVLMEDLVAEAASIYGRVPRAATARSGWRMHLRELRGDGDERR